MPGMEKLHLEDALDDSPQMKNLVGVFEKDATVLRQYTQGLHGCCRRIFNAQNELTAATQGLSAHLKAYDSQNFPLGNDDTVLVETLKQFSVYFDEVSSIQQILLTQLGDGVMYPLGKFLQADLDEIMAMCDMYKLSGTEYENSLTRYMKLPKKKENEKLKQETCEDLAAMRRKYYQTALHYFSSLNALQYKRRSALLEPLVGYLYSQKAFFEMGREVADRKELAQFLSNIQTSIQGVQQELTQETQKTVEQIETIEKQSRHKYVAEPLADVPYEPPNTDLAQKAGYLFLRSKQALLASKWERCYFFIQGGNLMVQHKDEFAGSLILDLNEGATHAEPTDSDDRKYVFQVISPTQKKTVILQAENEHERDEWIATIHNAVQDSSYTKGVPTGRPETLPTTKQIPASVLALQTKSHKKPDREETSQSKEGQRDSSSVTTPSTTSPSSTQTDSGFIPDAPIQFDIITPTKLLEENLQSGKEGPPNESSRINPFDQGGGTQIVDNNTADNAAFSQTFLVRFLGSMEVRKDRGDQMVHETIRQIMAARAIHNVFKTTESHLIVSSHSMRLIDPSNNQIRTEFQLEDISYWCAHKENKRLFAFVTRTKPASEGGHPSFACHVFECNTSGDEICLAITTATKLAFEVLMAQRTGSQQQPSQKSPASPQKSPASSHPPQDKTVPQQQQNDVAQQQLQQQQQQQQQQQEQQQTVSTEASGSVSEPAPSDPVSESENTATADT